MVEDNPRIYSQSAVASRPGWIPEAACATLEDAVLLAGDYGGTTSRFCGIAPAQDGEGGYVLWRDSLNTTPLDLNEGNLAP